MNWRFLVANCNQIPPVDNQNYLFIYFVAMGCIAQVFFWWNHHFQGNDTFYTVEGDRGDMLTIWAIVQRTRPTIHSECCVSLKLRPMCSYALRFHINRILIIPFPCKLKQGGSPCQLYIHEGDHLQIGWLRGGLNPTMGTLRYNLLPKIGIVLGEVTFVTLDLWWTLPFMTHPIIVGVSKWPWYFKSIM